MSWLDALGWGRLRPAGVLVGPSESASRRLLNLEACLILVVFNWMLGIWPMVAMNIVLSAINL